MPPFSAVALRAVRLVAQVVALLPEALRQAVQPLGAPLPLALLPLVAQAMVLLLAALPLDQVLPQEVVRRRLVA